MTLLKLNQEKRMLNLTIIRHKGTLYFVDVYGEQLRNVFNPFKKTLFLNIDDPELKAKVSHIWGILF